MRFILILLSISFVTYEASSQRPTYTYEAIYSFTYTRDTINIQKSTPDLYNLLCADGESRFYYRDWVFNDSMRNEDAMSHPRPTTYTDASAQKHLNEYMQRSGNWKKPVNGDEYKIQKLLNEGVTNVLLPGFPPRYMQVDNKLDWRITDQEKNINGYPCTLATVRYGGRDYEAWFTPEIPVPDGPYVFGGLPGLIVSVADTRGWYHFELVDFNPDVGERYWRADYLSSVAQPIQRAKFVETMVKQKNNFSMAGVDMTAEDIARVKAARLSRFYLLLEQND